MTQTQKRIAIYCRVSTDDQSCDRQERDLLAYANRSDYQVITIVKETASGTDNKRPQRAKLIELARRKMIDAILVTELTRWGRSTTDLLSTVEQLATYKCSLVAQTGFDFDLSTPQGRLILTLLSGISQFERDLLRERTKSGLANARARGKTLGRKHGFSPVAHKTKLVQQLHSNGKSIRWIARDQQLSTTTVQAMLKRTN